jgi:hypothetical protein
MLINKIFLNVCRKINFLDKKIFFEKKIQKKFQHFSTNNLISFEASKVLWHM